MNAQPIPIGATITANYRPEKYKGQVLSELDPRAWANTLAFPTATPNPEAVKEHVTRCQRLEATHYPDTRPRVPVLWDFGRVYWEYIDSLEVVA